MSVQVKDFPGDDAAAIQAAVNKTWFAPAQGGVVVLEPRDYTLHTPLYLPPRTILRGEGFMSTRLIAGPQLTTGDLVLMAYNQHPPITDYCHGCRLESLALVSKPGVNAARVVAAGVNTGFYHISSEGGNIIHEGFASILHLCNVYLAGSRLILRATPVDANAGAYSAMIGGTVHITSLETDHQTGPVIALNGGYVVTVSGWRSEQQAVTDTDALVLVTSSDLGGGPAQPDATPTVEILGGHFDFGSQPGRALTVFAVDNATQNPHFAWSGYTTGSQLVRAPGGVISSMNGVGAVRSYYGSQVGFSIRGDWGSNLTTTAATVTELDADVKMTSALQTAQGARLDAAVAQVAVALTAANSASSSFGKLRAALNSP